MHGLRNQTQFNARSQESNKIQCTVSRIKQNSMHSLKASVNLGEYGRDGTILMRSLGKKGMDWIGLYQETVQWWNFVITKKKKISTSSTNKYESPDEPNNHELLKEDSALWRSLVLNGFTYTVLQETVTSEITCWILGTIVRSHSVKYCTLYKMLGWKHGHTTDDNRLQC